MIARIHDDGQPKIGSTLSLIGLSIHLGRGVDWVRRQGVTLTVRGETWQADFYNGGRRRGYQLLSRVPVSMCTPSTVQQDGAAAMK